MIIHHNIHAIIVFSVADTRFANSGGGENRGAEDTERGGCMDGVSLSPLGEGSEEGKCPFPRKKF